MAVKILGTGRGIPKNYMTNDDIAKLVDTSDEWIKTRVGIEKRHLVENESTTSMAIEAAKNAMENAGVQPEEIDLVLLATVTNDKVVPNTACVLQAELGLKNAIAIDINSACAGFVVALNTAIAYFKAGIYKTALIIGAETLSKIVDWTDRTTCVLFGDGSGAAVVRADDSALTDFVQGSDGTKGGALDRGTWGVVNPFVKNDAKVPGLYMDGQAVYKFAVKIVPKCIEELLERNNLDKSEIKYYIVHQANLRIIQTAIKRLGEPEGKFPVNVDRYGNTSSASIPILLDELNRDGKIQRGDKIIFCGFGGGLSWAATLVTW